MTDDDADRTHAELPVPARSDPPTDDTELIAYLDGELDTAAASRVQARLANDPGARAAAESFKKSFDLLDYLPTPEPKPDFTARTVTRLQPAAQYRLSHAFRRRLWPELIAWGSAAILVLVMGYVGHSMARSSRPNLPAEPTQADLEVIERLQLYVGVDDLAFLTQLDNADLFASEPPTLQQPAESPPSLEERNELIAAFRKLPPARQEQLRVLHKELSAVDPTTSRQLRATLEAYAVWLHRLSDDERGKVLAAPTAADRLVEIRQVKEGQWRATLSRTQKERLKTVQSTKDREDLAAYFRLTESRRREEWELAHRQWRQVTEKGQKPWPFDDPARVAEIEAYIRVSLGVDLSGPPPERRGFTETQPRCRLTREQFVELQTLHEAAKKEGNWSWLFYGACLLRLSDSHPSLPLPGEGKKIVTGPENLPREYGFFGPSKGGGFNPKGGGGRDSKFGGTWNAVGKWPEFALQIHDLWSRRPKGFGGGGPSLPPLGPCKPGDFTTEVNAFLKGPLAMKLSSHEANVLRGLEGKWPEYPRKMMEFARKHDLGVPGVTLPGEPSKWDALYRLPNGKR